MHTVQAKGILSAQNGMNVYRGCTHGCIYCDARSECYQFTHEFTDIEVKENAPELLEKALRSKRKRCMIGTGAMCDPYIPLEDKLQITRRCLELIDRYHFGATVHTKSSRVLRDLELFESINHKAKAVVQMTLTTYDDELCRLIEPAVSVTSERFQTLCTLRDHGIPTIVWMTPILPFINDTEENLRGLLDYCVRAGVKGIILWDFGVTLRAGDREYFYEQLDQHFPGMKERYQREFGLAYECSSPSRKKLFQIFVETCREHNIMYTPEACFQYLHELPEKYEQISLFDL